MFFGVWDPYFVSDFCRISFHKLCQKPDSVDKSTIFCCDKIPGEPFLQSINRMADQSGPCRKHHQPIAASIDGIS